MGAPIDDELVLLHVDQGQYYSLKGVGPQIWERLATPQTIDDLVAWVCQNFEVAEHQARLDVERFLSKLLEADVIERVKSAP